MSLNSTIIIDWENIPQFSAIEKLIIQKYKVKLLAKIAVGNFCGQTKVSEKLHQHNYLMLNVPTYSNSADGKIITITMLLATLCRQIKVFYIVSNDCIFKTLQSALIMLGKTVYLVTTTQNSIFANCELLGEITSDSTTKNKSNSSLTSIEDRIRCLIAQEHKCRMEYGQLHQAYKAKYGIKLQAEYQAAKQTGKILKYLQSSSRFILTKHNNGYVIKLAKS